MGPRIPRNVSSKNKGRVVEAVVRSKHYRLNRASISNELSLSSDSSDSDTEISGKKSTPPTAHKKSFCFAEDSSSSSSDVPLSRFVTTAKKSHFNSESNFNIKTDKNHKMVSANQDDALMITADSVLNEESNSSDAPLVSFKSKTIESMDESSNDTSSNLKTKKFSLFVEDSNSGDVPDEVKQTFNSSDDEPNRNTSSNQNGTGINKIRKRKRAVSSDDEEPLQTKVKKAKKNFKGAMSPADKASQKQKHADPSVSNSGSETPASNAKKGNYDKKENNKPKVKNTKETAKEETNSGMKHKLKKRCADSSMSNSDDEMFPSKATNDGLIAKKEKFDSDSSENEYEKSIFDSNELTVKTDSETSSEKNSDTSTEALSKTPSKSFRLEDKSLSSFSSSKKKAQLSDKKMKHEKEHGVSPELQISSSRQKSTNSLRKNAMKTIRKLDSSASSSSENDSMNEKSEISSGKNTEANISANNKKESYHKTAQKKKQLRDSSSDDEDDTKTEGNSKQENRFTTTEVYSSSRSLGGSSDSDDDNEENVTKKKESSDRESQSNKISGYEKKANKSSCSSASDSSDSEEKEETRKGDDEKKSKHGKNVTSKQSSDSKVRKDNPRIVRLQRYLKVAGIRVPNYKILWEGCKSDKAKAAKLLELLEEHGLKGKPTLSECKKLRKKLETEREVAELNTGNIIQTKGRPRRNAQSLYATPFKDEEKPSWSPKKSPEFKKAFIRLKTVVDSEDSD